MFDVLAHAVRFGDCRDDLEARPLPGEAEEAKPTASDPNDDPQPIEVGPWWRTASGIASLGGLGSGTVAVFVTQVEAGPVALLATGLIFGMVAIAGVVPWRIKFGETELELRRAKRQNRALTDALTETAKAAAQARESSADDTPPDVANRKLGWDVLEAILDDLSIAAPVASSAVVKALAYEQRVLQAVSEAADQLGVEFSIFTRSGAAYGFDGELRSSLGYVVPVEVKFSTGAITRGSIENMLGRLDASGADKLLLITGEHPRRGIGMTLSKLNRLDWVVVKDSTDTQSLVTTIESALRLQE